MRKKSVKCEDLLSSICDSLDADPNSKRCIQLAKHMEKCPDCKAYRESLVKILRLYRNYPEEKLSRRSEKMIMHRLGLGRSDRG